MTNQEALDNAKKTLDWYKRESSRDLSLFGEMVKSFYKEQIEYYELIVKALEKQFPQKPNYEGDGYADGAMVYDTWICPLCGKRYEVDYDIYKHCPNCGQAVDLKKEDPEDE